jgi:hypothetical protein
VPYSDSVDVLADEIIRFANASAAA